MRDGREAVRESGIGWATARRGSALELCDLGAGSREDRILPGGIRREFDSEENARSAVTGLSRPTAGARKIGNRGNSGTYPLLITDSRYFSNRHAIVPAVRKVLLPGFETELRTWRQRLLIPVEDFLAVIENG